MKRQLRSSVSKPLIRNMATSGTPSPPNSVLSRCDLDMPAATIQGGATIVERLAINSATKTETETGRDPGEPDPKSRRIDGFEDNLPVAPTKRVEHGGSVTSQSNQRSATALQEPVAVDRASAVLRIEQEMCRQLPRAPFVSGKVTHVYNPLEHAAVPHGDYVRRCLGHGGGVPFLMVGMNPGPWGMSQTGVPFGEVAAVRDWMGVSGAVVPPEDENPHRPITGFNCSRSEVSGRRFWGLWQRQSGSPHRLFRHVFVHNFCPLAFMERSGKNVTPNCLGRPLRDHLEPICQKALIDIIQTLQVHTVVGIGKYAEDQARRALRAAGMADRVRVYPLLHPSPINPQANKDWDAVAIRQLKAAGLLPLPEVAWSRW